MAMLRIIFRHSAAGRTFPEDPKETYMHDSTSLAARKETEGATSSLLELSSDKSFPPKREELQHTVFVSRTHCISEKVPIFETHERYTRTKHSFRKCETRPSGCTCAQTAWLPCANVTLLAYSFVPKSLHIDSHSHDSWGRLPKQEG